MGLAVRKNTIVMVGIAVVFGLLAVFVAQGWLNYQAELGRKTVAPKPQAVATRTIVVAAGPLRFGAHVTPDSCAKSPGRTRRSRPARSHDRRV